jgi:hypothetical protein
VILGSRDRLIFSLFVPPFWSRFIYVARSLVPDSVSRTPFSCMSSSFYRQIQSPCFLAVERASVCCVTQFGRAAIRVHYSVQFMLQFGGFLVMPDRCSIKYA